MFNKHFRRALACASLAAVVAASAPASAQQIDRIVAFGDSLADTGNALQILLSNPALPPATRAQLQTLYPTGRFSGGTNYIDTLSQILDAPVLNYAVGGAQTGGLNQFGPIPGFTQETAIFLSRTTPPGTIFPVNAGFQQGDLLALSIGVNDGRAFFQANPGATTAQAQAAAATSVVNATNNLNLLVGAGAPTISYVSLNAGLTPDVLANPAAQALGNAFSTAFNTGFQTTLAGYAANGLTVHYLDGPTVLANVAAHPGAYGISSLYCPAPTPAAPGCLVNASGFLFYADGIHPTSDGMRIIAQYVATQLAAPLTLQAPGEVGLDTAKQWGRSLASRTDLYGRSGVTDGLRLFASADAFAHSLGRNAQTSAFDSKGGGGTVGGEYGLPMGLVGIAANYTRAKADFGNESADDRDHSWQIGAYGSVNFGAIFGQAHVGYGHDKHRLTRAGVVEDLAARPSGNHTVAGVKAGYLMPVSGLQLGPIVALDYARAKVSGYTESGDPALTLSVGGQRARSLTGGAGLEVRGNLAGLHAFVDGTVEHEFEGSSGDTISFAQTSAPIIVNHWAIDRRKDTYGRVGVGARADVTSGIGIDVSASATLGRSGGHETSARIGLNTRF